MNFFLKLLNNYIGFILVIAISLLAVYDLTNYGIPPTHDGEYHIMRFWQFNKNIEEGLIYPRWAPDFNNGYGIPLFNYVYPLPNYFAYIFSYLGFSLIESLKLNFAVASIIGAIFFYFWTKKYWGEWGGVVSSAFYTFSPYHFLDIYVRGSVGEVWSLAIFPMLLWSYKCFLESGARIYFLWSVLALALLVLAHNILALIFFLLFVLYALFELNKKINISQLLNLLLIMCFGLGLSAPFWLPAIFETKYVTGLQIFNPTEHFPALYKLIYSSWGYGFSGVAPSGAEGQMSFQIGLANLLAVALSIFIAIKNKNSIMIFFLIWFFILVFLITPLSSFLWENVPFVSYVQFPWRLLSGVIVASAFLAGSIVSETAIKDKKQRVLISILLIILSIGLSLKYAKAPFYHERDDMHYLERANFTDGTNSPGNLFNTIWLNQVPVKENIRIEEGVVKIIKDESEKKSYILSTQKDQRFYPNIAYFPGWTIFVNNKEASIINENGLLSVDIKKGLSKVDIVLTNTSLQSFSYILFLISLSFLALSVGYPAIIKKW